MYLRNYMPDMASVLAVVADRVRDLTVPVGLHLDHTGTNGYCERLGIRPVLSTNSEQDKVSLQAYWSVVNSKTANAAAGWNSLKDDTLVEGLSALLRDCPVIRFANWAKTTNASDLWYGLLADIIKPLNKRDFEFLFNPGDVSKMLVFEVDEILDIMGDYASYGRVTLALDEQEADQLWSRLNGRASYATSAGFRSPVAKEKYLFLFNAMRIDVLLVQDDNRTVLLSRDGQSELAGRPVNKINKPGDGKEYFYAGYELGLLLHLEVPHCVALGYAVAGAYRMQATRPDPKALLTYIADWMAELHPAEALQQ